MKSKERQKHRQPDKEKYYYIRSKYNHPVVTLCILKFDDNYYKGVSICSFSEKEIKKEEGRKLAKKRAYNAYYKHIHKHIAVSDPILRSDALTVLKEQNVANEIAKNQNSLIWKSEYLTSNDLTDFEKKLFKVNA